MFEIHDTSSLADHLDTHGTLDCTVLQGLDLANDSMPVEQLCQLDWSGATILGGVIPDDLRLAMVSSGAIVLPRLPNLPFLPYRPRLYELDELMAGYKKGSTDSIQATTDYQIYLHAKQVRDAGKHASVMSTLFQRIHDHAVDDAMNDFLVDHDRVVAIMGGHALKRDEQKYADVVELGRRLARENALVVSGGGPGAMEAANLGAWLAPHPDTAAAEAIATLSGNTDYRTAEYLDLGYEVRSAFPDGAASLAIPTWFYGHEPTNQFATHIAKYFSNSIREDGLLAIATHGVVFTPGSAGTVQEIFQDATQNHYATFEHISPMVFLGREYWTNKLPVMPLIEALSAGRPYAELIAMVDTPDEVVEFLNSHPPIPSPE